MKSIITFLKNNYLLIIGILIVAFYSVSPQLIFEKQLDDDYRGIYLSTTDAELYFTARVQEIKDGYYSLGNAYLYENKGDPYLLPPLGELIMVGFGSIFNLSTTQIMIYGSKLFFPVLLFVAIYFFVFVLGQDKKIALVVALAVFLDSKFVHNIDALTGLFSFSAFPDFSHYLRPINPQISSLIFFSFLTFFYLSLKKKKAYLWILAGLFLGLGFNIYFFTWAFSVSFILLLGLFFIIKKRFDLFKIIAKVLAGGLIVSVPYWYTLFQAINTPQFSYAANNQGLIDSHAPIFSKISLIVIVVYLLTAKFLKLPKNLNHYFLLALSLTTLVVINQQIITGKELYHGHFHWYYNIPVFIIVLLFCFNLFVKRYLVNFKNMIFVLLFLLFVYGGLVVYVNASNHNFDYFAGLQKYGWVVEWVNNNNPENTVIVSDDLLLNSMIPAYTSADVYLAEQASWYFASRQRIEHNYLIYIWLKKVSPDDIENYLNNHKREISIMSSLDIKGKHYSCVDCITPQMVDYLSQRYREYDNNGFANQLKKYKADYLVSSDGGFEQYDIFKLISQNKDFYIYKISYD